jgi:glycosyltransferase involved in cell wall biosynthesis
MKITHISTTDQAGGAARAAYRLHRGLLELGCESRMLVQRKVSNDPTVTQFSPPVDPGTRLRRSLLRRLLAKRRRALESLPKGATFMSDDRSEHGADILNQLPGQDVLNLHWVAGCFDYRLFFRRVPSNLPIIWTLHDMNPFTGGCHYDGGCGKYLKACEACPQLNSTHSNDFSSQSWHRKEDAFRNMSEQCLYIVTPSNWLAHEVKKSSLLGKFPVSVIPNGLDTEAFQPRNKQFARQLFKIPEKAKVILFLADAAEEKRKGLHVLLESLAGIESKNDFYLLGLGRGLEVRDLRIPYKNLGYIREDITLSLVYSAADIFVAPSLQDNLPNTIVEAIACGLPVVASSVGGCVDLVREGETGILVKAGDCTQLHNAMINLLQDPPLRGTMSKACRQFAERQHSLKIQASSYQELYHNLTERGPSPGAKRP